MEKDLFLVEEEEDWSMTMDQFTKKWYGKVSRSKIEEIKKEVSLEFSAIIF